MAVDIKNLSDYSEKIRNVSHILTETLGTTTSYTFLEDTLLPYVKKNLKDYVLDHWNDDEIVEIVKTLKKQAGSEVKQGWVGAIEIPEGDDGDAKDAIITYALSQLDGSNVEALNRLIVKDGYSKGNLKGHVFPDVIPAFKKWTEEGKKIYIYSSGVEMSQQCFVSVDGDISELISGCFESSEFPGDSCESFRELCKKVNSPANKIAFLTHNASTASAAHKAGLVVIMLSREGNRYIGNCTRENFPVITSFEDLSKQICGKRKQAPDSDESTEGKRAKLDEVVSKKETEVDKPEEEAVKTPDKKPVEKSTAVVVDGEVDAESKASGEQEEMEVDEASEESKAKDEKAGAAEITVVVTPPPEEVVELKGGEDGKVNGGPEKAMETAEEAKAENEDEKEKSESPIEKEVSAEKVEEKVPENKEEDKEEESKAKESKEKVVKDSESEKTETEKDTKEDNGAVEVKADEGGKAEDKVDETPSAEAEKTKENGVAEAMTLENGASGEEGKEKKEVNGNGIDGVNGEGDGAAGKEVDEPTAAKEPEKIVAKKVEKEEEKVEVTAEAVKESA